MSKSNTIPVLLTVSEIELIWEALNLSPVAATYPTMYQEKYREIKDALNHALEDSGEATIRVN